MANKRKAAGSNKTPAKKRKVEATKKTPSSTKKVKTPTPKKVTSTKVKKVEPKSKDKTPKTSKTPAKSTKTPEKRSKSAKPPVKKATPKPAPKKDVKKSKLSEKTVTRTKLEKAKVTAMKAKVEKAKALKAKAAASKAKLKTTKSAAKPKTALKAQAKAKPKPAVKADAEKKGKTPAKKPEKTPAKQEEKKIEPQKKEPQKKAEEKKPTSKAKVSEKKEVAPESATKRKKISEEASTEAPRKRRMITPNKKFADFELDVPAKRTITPNKKYADFETDTSPKRVSELRAFIQDKKKSPAAETPSSPEKTKMSKTAASAKKSEKDSKTETPARDIKVFKPSDMKPAEKLMKKLQKKLEKEAKSVSTPKPVENREKAKIKITKVVTYDKPMSSDEKEMRALKATPKSKTVPAVKTVTAGVHSKTPKQPAAKLNVTKANKATPKATPKAKAPEKQPPKPKKIKELPRAERPIQAKFTSQKNIKLKDDNDQLNCWITGISVFPSGEIIMVDMTNRKIKLFSKDFDFLSQVKLDTIPQDISVSPVNVSDAYFTKPFSKEGIQKVTMSDGKLTLKESFWTNGTNRGITCTKNGILTSVQDGRYHDLDINHFKIDLLDYEGKVLQSVSTDSNGSRLFKLPLYFTVNNTGKQMIVADCIKHYSYVVSVDMTGKIKFKYEGIGGNLVTPRGLTIDDEDNIYITEWERHNVYVLSPTGKRMQVLFTHQELVEDGLDGLQKPYQLCFYKEDIVKKLIVSQEGCNTVKIFQMFKKAPETEESKQAAVNAVEEKKDIPNGEASPTKRKPAPPKKNGSQTKGSTIVTFTADEVKSTNEAAVEKAEQVAAQPKETDGEKVAEEGPSTEVEKAESREETFENAATNESDTDQNVETAEPEEVPVTTEEEKEEGPPVLNPEFGEEFETAENETEENSSVQDAINSLNDSQEDHIVNDRVESGVEANLENDVDASQVQVEVYEQINVPHVETVDGQQEIVESMNVKQGDVQVPEEMNEQQVELVNSQYEQVLIPEEAIITTQSVDTEIQSVPIESISHETIIIQQDVNQMNPQPYEKIETVTVNNNDASNLIQTETVQYVSDMNMQGNYATNIAQSEIVTTEVPEEIVTMVTETV